MQLSPTKQQHSALCTPLSPSGCTFWGKKPWSRKKKILWQLGTLVGAPVGIALIAGIAIPAMIIGIPVYVGRKVRRRPAATGSDALLLWGRAPPQQSALSDPQSLRGQRHLQAQEEPGDRRRRDSVCHRLSCGCSSNCRCVAFSSRLHFPSLLKLKISSV